MSLLQMHMRFNRKKSSAMHLPLCNFSLSRQKRNKKIKRGEQHAEKECQRERKRKSTFFCFKLAKDIHVVVLVLYFILFLFENYLIQFVAFFFVCVVSPRLLFLSFNIFVVCRFAECWKLLENNKRKQNKKKKEKNCKRQRRRRRRWQWRRTGNQLSGLSTAEFMPHWNKLFALFFAYKIL